MAKKRDPGSWKDLFHEVEVVAAIIGVIGTIIGTLLVSVLLSYLEGRLGLGSVVGLIVFMLLAGIWILLAIRWGVRVAAGAAAIMMILGSSLFLFTRIDFPRIGGRAQSVAVSPGETAPAVPATPIAPSPTAQTAPASPTATPRSTLSPASATPLPQPVARSAPTPFAPQAGWTSFTNANRVHVLALQGDSLWAGGNGGLVRWNRQDGTYEKFTVDNGLVSNDVTALYVDDSGLLWVGTSSGISRFDGAGWEKWSRQTGLPGQQVVGFAPDGAGGVWIGFTDAGVSHYDPQVSKWIDAWRTYGPDEGLPGDSVEVIAVDAEGRLWLSIYDAGVVRFEPESGVWTPLAETGLDVADGTVLLNGRGGDVSTLAGQQLAYLNAQGDNWETLSLSAEVTDAGIAAWLLNRDGNLWVGTWGYGVARYDGDRWLRFDVEDGLADFVVRDIVEDADGLLWFATPAGVSRLDPVTGAWKTFATADILPSNRITAMAQDQSGALWFGHAEGGLSQLDLTSGEWSTLGEAADIYSVEALAVDQDGALWVGVWNGVRRYDGQRWQAFTREDGLAEGGVESIEPAPDGTLWFGGEGGVSHFDPEAGKWQTFTTADGLPAGNAYVLHVATDGQVWVSGGDTLVPVVFDGEVWGPPPGAADVPETVYGVAELPDGTLWVAAGRLFRYEAGVWQVVPDPEDRYIEGVAAAPDGTIWTQTYDVGIRRYDPATGQWQSFTPTDGLAAVEVNTIFVDQQGAVWVGTSAGLSRWGGG